VESIHDSAHERLFRAGDGFRWLRSQNPVTGAGANPNATGSGMCRRETCSGIVVPKAVSRSRSP
jgi:hypothetical protein